MNHYFLLPAHGTPAPVESGAPLRHLYAHIPFCPAKCDYCAFVTHVGGERLIGPYVAALRREAESVARHVETRPLQTVYLGGGTPSMLSPAQVTAVLGTFDRSFSVAPGAEISLEAHPSTVDAGKLEGFRRAGVNRISFGVESLAPRELRALHRMGDELTPLTALRLARQSGFTSIAVDLMYGIPMQTVESWRVTLEHVISAGPDHLSLYPLQIEPKTVFDRRHRSGQLVLPDDDLVVDMYFLACETLSRAGFLHYEVGSWCRPGHESRHNLGYWHNQPYLGLGVGAHGYSGAERTVNVRHTTRYIHLVESGQSSVAAVEHVDAGRRRTETIMLGLRLLAEGLSVDTLQAVPGSDAGMGAPRELRALREAGFIRVDGGRVFLAESAVPVANEVWERLAC